MMKGSGKVIAGEFTGKLVSSRENKYFPSILLSLTRAFALNTDTVESYEVLNEEQKQSGSIGRGIVGGTLFGTAGAVVGAMSGKSRQLYQVAVYYRDGGKSLIEMDDITYKLLVKACF